MREDAIYEDDSVVVCPSPIEGLGVFAKRPFKTGELVLKWRPILLTESELARVAETDRRYLNKLADGTIALMGIPERFVNHADDPNTLPENDADVAVRDIRTGEEVTSRYLTRDAA